MKTPQSTVGSPAKTPTRNRHSRRPVLSDRSRWKQLCIAGLVVAIVIVATTVGAVIGVRVNRYPDYDSLNYRLKDTYQGTSFFDGFKYFSDTDPTNGFVVYVSRDVTQDQNLTYASDHSAVLRVDATTPRALAGRKSVRVESIATYDTGLFIFDIIHTPYGCGTWPALWLTDGYNWPQNGEIDVLESTNGGLSGNSGCGVLGDSSTYGQELNANGGGVYALELRAAGIRVWFFPRDTTPSDIAYSSPTPNPSQWGTAVADFPSTKCNIHSHFRNLSIIINIALCGDMAAQPLYYKSMYDCPSTCTDFVANNPSDFQEAYWEFGSFKVFQAI
ncbi:Endo-1,3(4)-beta-glucanase [Penicillium ucsense]|uniref:Endo-1,3(4)-beta-glucanase n=1 Tax=Penicillium ucsense TaxID=2839758 RepID=A0A8J8WHB9_9EURO|nr:Endo-1,3(4)-beta-glucanase [Penicillium ucsense]KAF7734595.1 Endo-1,3(4)-beta-glucanase [Penicillium ucsense]